MESVKMLDKIQAVCKGGDEAALATIISTKGSTPRKAGSKMIVFPTGMIQGTIGGGCGEAEVIEAAFNVMRTLTPMVLRVDLTKGLLYEDGGICGGVMDVFIEPLSS